MAMMQAVVSYGAHQPLKLEQRPVPAIGPNDLLIKIERCGICGSDLHAHDFLDDEGSTGSILGHEISGVVTRIGDEVQGFAIGQRIVVYTAVGCGACKACQIGNATICPDAQWVSGGYAEYICVPAIAAIAVPENLSPAQAALIEPLAVSLYGLRAANISAGERVLVHGAGSIALAAIWWAKRLGAGKVVCLYRSARREQMARAMGADAFITNNDDEAVEIITALGGSPEVAAECIGVSGALERAVTHAGLMGRVVSLGLGATADPIIPAAAGMKGVSIQFPVGYTMQDFHDTIGALLDHAIDPQIMISSVVSLKDVPETFAALSGSHNQTKVHIAP